MLHDCNPITEHQQREVQKPSEAAWLGTVWKAWVSAIISFGEDAECFTIDADFGCGILRPKNECQAIRPVKTLISYDELDRNRKSLLNLMSVEEFLEKY